MLPFMPGEEIRVSSQWQFFDKKGKKNIINRKGPISLVKLCIVKLHVSTMIQANVHNLPLLDLFSKLK